MGKNCYSSGLDNTGRMTSNGFKKSTKVVRRQGNNIYGQNSYKFVKEAVM